MKTLELIFGNYGILRVSDLRYLLIMLDANETPENAAISFSYDGEGELLHIFATAKDDNDS